MTRAWTRGRRVRGAPLKLAAIKRRFTEDERREIGKAVAAHFEQCGWQVFTTGRECTALEASDSPPPPAVPPLSLCHALAPKKKPHQESQ
jgi:hypothetical protein